jgi:hypothetical protein
MIIQGDLFVESVGTDGFYDCNFGEYQQGTLKLKTKFWNRNIAAGVLVSFVGIINRCSKTDNNLWVDVKSYVVKGEPKDEPQLLLTLNCHGVVQETGLLKSQTWHGKELGLFGDFLTHFAFKAKDPVNYG